MPTRISTKPKGATSYKETAFGILPRSKLLKVEVEGTKKGLEWIHTLMEEDGSLEISPELILTLHNVAFGWIFPAWAGKFRTVQVVFSGKEAPSYFQVPELMANLCQDLKERISHLLPGNELYIEQVVELLAWFQHRFVYIHPFLDYNGRLARMLTALVLLKFNLPPIEIKVSSEKDRIAYLNAMYAADDGDLSKLEKIIASALNESFQSVSRA